MSAKNQSSSGQPVLQFLVVGREEQRSALQEILHSQASFSDVQVDDASQLSDVLAKLATKLYDLVVFAQREPETETAQWIVMLRLKDRRWFYLFRLCPASERTATISHPKMRTLRASLPLFEPFRAR